MIERLRSSSRVSEGHNICASKGRRMSMATCHSVCRMKLEELQQASAGMPRHWIYDCDETCGHLVDYWNNSTMIIRSLLLRQGEIEVLF